MSSQGDPNSYNNGSVNGNNNPRSMTSKIIMVLGALMALFLLRNIMVKDYDDETTSYLKSVGHEESVDRIIPKTTAQLIQEKLAREKLIDNLATNYTMLRQEVTSLRSDVAALKAQPSVAAAAPEGDIRAAATSTDRE